jgi:gephyrin
VTGRQERQERACLTTLRATAPINNAHSQHHRLPQGCGAAAGQLGWFATSTGNQISSRLLSARSANALLELPRAEGVIEAGSTVSALVIDDLGCMEQASQEVPPTAGFV